MDGNGKSWLLTWKSGIIRCILSFSNIHDIVYTHTHTHTHAHTRTHARTHKHSHTHTHTHTHTHKHTHNFSISNNFGIFPRFGSGSETIDELHVVLGGQPSPFFYNRIREKKFSLPVVNDNEIVRNTSDRVEGKPVFLFGALFETVGADVFLVIPWRKKQKWRWLATEDHAELVYQYIGPSSVSGITTKITGWKG